MIVLDAAAEEYSQCVRDDKSGARRIDQYIREGLGWTWTRKYKPQKFEWCGAFAAWCYAHADLALAVRKKHLASCYRLHKWSHGNARRIDVKDIKPGDIAVVGPEPAPRTATRAERKARPPWGRHITMVRKVRSTYVETFEGNARGRLPDGKGEGVIKHTRPFAGDSRMIYRVLYGVRPLPEDYDGR